MNMRKSVLFAMLVIALIGSFAGLANASGCTYELTANYGETDVPLGATVTVTAKTNNPNAYKVIFMWVNPANKVEIINAEYVEWNGSYINGKKVWVASSEYILDYILATGMCTRSWISLENEVSQSYYLLR